MWKVREKGATSGAGVLAAYGYDDLGRRTSLTKGNGASTSYSYDPVSRLSQMGLDFGGTTHDLALTFSYNPASQIVSTTRSNDLYAWTGHGSGTTLSTADGKNQLASHGGATVTHDAKGNLTSDGTYNYTYTSENLLTSFSTSGLLEYDPLMRFYKNYGTYFIRDGAGAGQLLGEYYNGNISARYVPGAAMDEPVAHVDKFGARTGYHADERGSVIAWSNDAGANARIIHFDEYGKRGAGGSFRLAYTGQTHILGDVYDYKSHNYNARLGRFLQTDRIGYGGGMNLDGPAGFETVTKYVYVVGAVFAASLCGACERAPCDQRMMLHVVNKDIIKYNRQPSEYKLAEIKRLSNGIYVGMSQNYSPTYRRHYIIDPKTCKIINAQVDQ